MNAFEYMFQQKNNLLSSDSEDEFSVEHIIDNKPRTKDVREFFRANLAGIRSEEEKLFAKN